MSDPEIRLHKMVAALRENQYRITPQRLAILRILAESKGHPSVEAIYAQVKPDFPTTSLATVYKNISVLKELNQVLELGFSDDSNRYDGNKPYDHPHVVCTVCKKILDPDIAALSNMTAELMRETGFTITRHRLDFFGVCPDCQAKKNQGSK
ncbi:Fur family transcriptional regulator [Desulfosarcina ovata]|uniref:Peroxide-responsive repressor PerR n=2 Tax=Desulfosarcina ovata TaxID=83564 RepID=A0A5K8AGH4_9BACT|nr:Fur family transcriptional regulator [Desulfosarcina ovata]BBO84439.1 peroxide-responsive repressor PerR [Desulfosarcina ovata subsp. sediminis]BBO90954.1 peroxide-responsive repressor PerR [Desulfosarcina ovata subsp. ovata]